MNEQRIYTLREEGYNCAETLLRHANDAYDLGLCEKAFHLMSGFGGGAMTEDFCGALTGAVAALSAFYSRGKAADHPELKIAVETFLTDVKKRIHPSTLCREIKPEWRTEAEGCTPLILAVARCLDDHMGRQDIKKT